MSEIRGRRTMRHLLDGSDGKGPLREVVETWCEGGRGSGDDQLLIVKLKCGHEKMYFRRSRASAPARARCSVCARSDADA